MHDKQTRSRFAHDPSRRRLLKGAGAAAAGLLPAMPGFAAARRIHIGLMLPASGTYAQLGAAIVNGFKLFVQQSGGTLGGAEVRYSAVDDESDPAKAPENANTLIRRDKVDALVGTVHSGVAMGMVKVVRGTGTPLIIPNAGSNAATGALCGDNVFRTSFSNWQVNHPMGALLRQRGHRRVVTMSWKYAAGEEMIGGFTEGFEAAGGEIAKAQWLPFPNVEFQPYLTEIASLGPDAVYTFFAGAGAAKFLKDYAAAGLAGKIPLFGAGFLTDGVLHAVDGAAEGVETALHYGDRLDLERNLSFRKAYREAYGSEADVYAVQGYDAAQLLASGLESASGDGGDRDALLAGMSGAAIDSPRGHWQMSAAHNPVQDIYLRKVQGLENAVIGKAGTAVEDPARGCRMRA